MKKIAIISLTGIGNNILFIPALKCLRREFPSAKITMLVVLRSVRDLFVDCPYIDEVLPLCEKKYNNLKDNLSVAMKTLKLRKERYDISITVFPSNRKEYNLLSFLLGAKTRLTHAYQSSLYRNLSFLQNRRVAALKDLHDVDQNLNLIKFLGCRNTDMDSEISVWPKDDDCEFACRFLNDYNLTHYKPIIGFHVTSYPDMKYKRWGAPKFVHLANELKKQYNAKIILFGAKDEEDEIESISKNISGDPIIATRNTIKQTAEIIRYCHLFISNDSGLMHLATAVNVPTIGIFGPTNFVRTGPYGRKHRIVSKGSPCSPCHRYPFVNEKLNPKCKTVDCLEEISTEDVFCHVTELMQGEGKIISYA